LEYPRAVRAADCVSRDAIRPQDGSCAACKWKGQIETGRPSYIDAILDESCALLIDEGFTNCTNYVFRDKVRLLAHGAGRAWQASGRKMLAVLVDGPQGGIVVAGGEEKSTNQRVSPMDSSSLWT
jgi:hypothetical protein